ncbi:MAG: hypothetical protein BWY78_00193 [Alphaproteobacteria bacterium ADurb.Bin438]|nr:MAG: hypothetical protein BWY78_00193 [Alphaproteobacteria bacterium ADurb.Bin438]
MKNKPLIEKEINNNVLYLIYQRDIINLSTYLKSLNLIKDKHLWGKLIFDCLLFFVFCFAYFYFGLFFYKNYKKIDDFDKFLILSIIIMTSFLIPLINQIKYYLKDLLIIIGFVTTFLSFYLFDNMFFVYTNYTFDMIIFVVLTFPIIFIYKRIIPFIIWILLYFLGVLFVNKVEHFYENKIVLIFLLMSFFAFSLLYFLRSKYK